MGLEMMWSQFQLLATAPSSSLSITSFPHFIVPQTNTSCSTRAQFSPLKPSQHILPSFSVIIPSLWRLSSSPTTKLRASLQVEDTSNDNSTSLLQQHDPPNQEVEESVRVLKEAAKTRKVAKDEVLSALSVIEKSKIDPSKFLDTLGGSKSPGRTWMLIFTAEKQLEGGRYFPLTAVQRFDAEARRIENGVYLGPLGSLSFEGRLSWKKKMLAFIFERIRIKIGPFNPLEVSLGNQDDREPNTKDPFFIWFYVDEEIAVARGRSGGTAFWCRCRRVP